MTTAAAPPATRRPTSLWSRAPGWLFHAAAAVGALLLLWSATYPLGGFLGLVIGSSLLAACVAVWFVRLVAFLVAHLAGPREPGGYRRFWPFLVAPAGAVVVIGIIASGAPFAVRWGLSEGAFDARADRLAARAEEVGGGRTRSLLRNDRVGLYEVTDAWVDGSGNVYFVIAGSGFIDSVGIARISGSVPPERNADLEFDHLDGDWYTFIEPFN